VIHLTGTIVMEPRFKETFYSITQLRAKQSLFNAKFLNKIASSLSWLKGFLGCKNRARNDNR